MVVRSRVNLVYAEGGARLLTLRQDGKRCDDVSFGKILHGLAWISD